MWFGLGSGEVHGLMITPLCSTIVLLTPIVMLAGGLMLFPRFELRNVVRGLLIAVPLAIVGNMIRYVLVAFALQVWGQQGFDIMHHWVGSVFVLLCTALAIVLLLIISARGRLTRRSSATGRHNQ
jgi:exosortase/archaeosortase family protein